MKKILLISMLFLLGAATALMADQVLYNGASFDVTLQGITGSTARLNYSADFAGWTANGQDYIVGIDFAFANIAPAIGSVTLVSAPVSLGLWSSTSGPLNASGDGKCGGNDSKTPCFIITANSEWNSLPTVGGNYTWTVDVTYAGAIQNTDFDQWSHLGALFAASDGDGTYSKTGTILSATGPTQTPEPSALILLGSGLVGLAGFSRLRMKK